MNSDISRNLSLKYNRFTTSDCKDIGIGNFKFVTMTHFLCYLRLLKMLSDVVRKTLLKNLKSNFFLKNQLIYFKFLFGICCSNISKYEMKR